MIRPIRSRRPGRLQRVAAAASLSCAFGAHGQAAPAEQRIAILPHVDVISFSPLPGFGVPRDQVPANVQTATASDIERRQALDLADFLNRSIGSLSINAMQGNAFQPDVNYRGFTASPLLGTPQGLSVYLDGVRLNQPFGDVVSWDLIPRAAIATIALMPGSNPLFGLNTLGGALSVSTKDGVNHPGTAVQLTVGSHRHAAIEFETGGARDGDDWYVTGNRLHDRGWRRASPSSLTQLFGKFGRRSTEGSLSLTTALADNELTGNGLQEQSALARDLTSVYTTPDRTRNRSVLLNLAGTRHLAGAIDLTGNAYYRRIRTATTNGDINDEALTESVYQPSAAERAALASAGYGGVPTAGETRANTPFPRWRCIANALLDSEPNEKCNGLVNTTSTVQRNFGFNAQATTLATLAGMSHRLLAGVGYDASRVRFHQASQFGYIAADRSIVPVTGPGAFADGSQDSENAFDARVDLRSRSHTASVFASDSIALDARTQLTIAARYNRNRVTNVDGITPGGGTGSLDGAASYVHLNPAAGITFAATETLTLYAGINQGSRSPTAIELGCADPASPCKLPNAFAGDPPLRQVVTTTVEAGLRGHLSGGWSWNAGVFRSDNRDDLLFVSDNASGFGYFRNFGRTRRQGLELGLTARPVETVSIGINLSVLSATYRSAEVVDGSANSSNSGALAGFPGTGGSIAIQTGDRIPLLPRHIVKLHADWEPNDDLSLGIDMSAIGSANARGNENGRHQPDGLFYTGPGRSAGYALFNLDARYKPTTRLTFFARIDNLFNRRYATAAQLGANGFDGNGNFAARAFARNANSDYPVASGTFVAPGAPRSATLGIRYTFGD